MHHVSLARVCTFVLDMDLALVLQARMYKEKAVETVVATIRESACYNTRCKHSYEVYLDAAVEKWHSHVAVTRRGNFPR